MGILNDESVKIVMNYIRANLSKINVKSGHCRYNFRCQHNAVHDALNNEDDRIAMCFYIDKGDYPIIHFLNVDKNGSFIDNTLGRWSEMHQYYLIRYIEKDDFFEVNKIFTAYREELRRKLPFFIRLLSNNEY